MDKSIAIITARGGSKRIHRKNIKDFLGKPIIEYSIEAAINSHMFSEVMVSTDDEEIKNIAIACGANVPFLRSKENSNDTAPTKDVIQEVLLEYEKLGEKFDYACCIYPTAPFITSTKLMNAMNLLIEKQADSVFPVIPYSYPPQRGLILQDGYIRFKDPHNELARSQDLEKIYHDCGQFYCLNTKEFKIQNKVIMKKSMPIVVSQVEAQDIDNEDDWEMAILKYQHIQLKNLMIEG